MKEEKIHTQVSNYLKIQYPNVYFNSESSGLRVSIGMAKKMKSQRSKHKQLDLMILEAKRGYHGLIIELKKSKEGVILKNGKYSKSKHIQEQLESIELLRAKGYYACFCFGFDETKKIIDFYLK